MLQEIEQQIDKQNPFSIENDMQNYNRRKGLGGSDANIIWNGYKPNMQKLLEIKQGINKPEDLSNNFRVQLGILTEDLNLWWFMNHSGYFDNKTMIMNMQHEVEQLNFIYPRYAHLDGYIRGKELDTIPNKLKREVAARSRDTFVECKHTNTSVDAWTKSRYYMPQLQFYMDILSVPYCYVSIIRGNEEPEILEIGADKDYQTRLNEKCKKFWDLVESNQSVVDSIPQYTDDKELENKIPINGMLEYDMDGTDWDQLSDTLAQTIGAVNIFDSNKKIMKELVPPDAKTATTENSNWIATRSKNLRLTLRRKTEKELS